MKIEYLSSESSKHITQTQWNGKNGLLVPCQKYQKFLITSLGGCKMTRHDKEKHSIFQNFYRINGSENQKKIVSSHFLQSPCSSLSVKNTITFHNRKIILSDNCSFPAKRNRYHSLSFTLSLILGYLNKLTEPKSSPVATNLLSLDRLQVLRSVPSASSGHIPKK